MRNKSLWVEPDHTFCFATATEQILGIIHAYIWPQEILE